MRKIFKALLLPMIIGLFLGGASTLPGHVNSQIGAWLGLPIWGHFFGYTIGPYVVCYVNRESFIKSWLLGVLTIVIANLTYYLLPVILSSFIDTIHLGNFEHMMIGFIMWTITALVLTLIFSGGFQIWGKGKKLWFRCLAITTHFLIFLFALYLDMVSFMIRMFNGSFAESSRTRYFSMSGDAGRLFIADVFWTAIGLLISLGIYICFLKRTELCKASS